MKSFWLRFLLFSFFKFPLPGLPHSKTGHDVPVATKAKALCHPENIKSKSASQQQEIPNLYASSENTKAGCGILIVKNGKTLCQLEETKGRTVASRQLEISKLYARSAKSKASYGIPIARNAKTLCQPSDNDHARLESNLKSLSLVDANFCLDGTLVADERFLDFLFLECHSCTH